VSHRRRKKEEGRRKKEEGRRKKEEGRRKKEEGRRKKEEGRRKKALRHFDYAQCAASLRNREKGSLLLYCRAVRDYCYSFIV
jgi:hypothetical protein